MVSGRELPVKDVYKRQTIDAAEKMDLQKAFGDAEAVALIDLMYNKTGDMQDNILMLYDSMGQGTAATQQMADAINNTEPAKFEQLKQKVHNTAESIGNTLLPTINDLMGRIDGVLTKADAWIANNQDLVRVIMQVARIVGAFLAVGGLSLIHICKAHKVGETTYSNLSDAKLSADSFIAARTTMMSLKNDQGQPLNLVPDTLLVPPALEQEARMILEADLINGTTNINKGLAKVEVWTELADQPTQWHLLCTKRSLKPFIFQEREKAKFVAMTKETDENVFMRDEYLYGVNARDGVGYGFWQMAYGSTGTTAG